MNQGVNFELRTITHKHTMIVIIFFSRSTFTHFSHYWNQKSNLSFCRFLLLLLTFYHSIYSQYMYHYLNYSYSSVECRCLTHLKFRSLKSILDYRIKPIVTSSLIIVGFEHFSKHQSNTNNWPTGQCLTHFWWLNNYFSNVRTNWSNLMKMTIIAIIVTQFCWHVHLSI